jgi:hypothetical protein
VGTWIKSHSNEDALSIYVEVKAEDLMVQRTSVVKGNERLSWNETFELYAHHAIIAIP